MKDTIIILLSIIALLFSAAALWFSFDSERRISTELADIKKNSFTLSDVPELNMDNPEDVVVKWYEAIWSTNAVPHFSLFDDAQFFRAHREEIKKTLEVVEVMENGNLAIAFVRYSIGSDLYREVKWLRKVDSSWTINLGYYSKYTDEEDDPVLKGKMDWLKKVIDKKDAWERDNEPIWWN